LTGSFSSACFIGVGAFGLSVVTAGGLESGFFSERDSAGGSGLSTGFASDCGGFAVGAAGFATFGEGAGGFFGGRFSASRFAADEVELWGLLAGGFFAAGCFAGGLGGFVPPLSDDAAGFSGAAFDFAFPGGIAG
jgi:hypothetical protein